MPHLKLHLLGSPELTLDGLTVDLSRRKALALLAYLATTAQTHRRDELAALFWPDYESSAARADLRRTLSVLNKALGSGMLVADRATVSLVPSAESETNLWLDVAEFRRLTAARQPYDSDNKSDDCLSLLDDAVSLYRGDFMAGFTLRDSPDFDDWQFFEGESLRQELAAALEQLAHGYGERGDFDRAIGYARRWLALDPLHEKAHRHLMRLYAWNSQHSAALRQYEQCTQIVAEEFGAPPSAETQELHAAIRTKKLPPPHSVPHAQTETIAPTPEEPATVRSAANELRLVTALCVGIGTTELTLEVAPDQIAAQVAQLTGLFEPIFARYQGRIEQQFGESVLAFFGVTQTHEDDIERALRVVLDGMEVARQVGLPVAAGVVTGHVYVEYADEGHNPQITGPVATLATRLQGAADAGETLVSHKVYRQTHDAFRLEPVSVRVRGTSDTVYQLLRPLRQPRKTRGIEGLRADLIGRDEELAKLVQSATLLQQGKGQMACVIGEAGLGKSRLAAELHRKFVSPSDKAQVDILHSTKNPSQLRWLEGRCLEMGISTRYWPIIDVLRGYLGWQFDDDEATRAGRVVDALDHLVAHEHLTQEQVEEIGPLLGNLLSLQFGTAWDERLRFADPQQVRHRTLIGLRDLFVAIAQEQPTVLMLEDLHWADALTLDLIALLMETLTETPLFLLCIYRPERNHRCWQLATQARQKCPSRFMELRLHELTPQQSQAMISSLLTVADLPETVRATILQKSGGNPFFVEEVVRSLIDAGMVTRDGDLWRANQRIGEAAVPETVQSVVMARVDRLEQSLRLVLQQAAIIGRLFTKRLLVQLVAAEIELERAINTLTEQAFIYPERVVPEEEYSFKHALVQDAIYQTMPQAQRSRNHQQVAAALETLYANQLDEVIEQLAHHYERSGVTNKAVEYLIQAGQKALRAYLNDDAIDYYQRAQVLLDQEAESTSIEESGWEQWQLATYQGLGKVYAGTGRMEEAEEKLHHAIALGKEMTLTVPHLIQLYYELGEVFYWLSKYEERIQIGEEGLALLEGDTESAEAVMMTSLVAWGHFFKGSYDVARRLTLRNASALPRLSYREEFQPAHTHIVIILSIFEKDIETALEWSHGLEEKAKQHHDLRALASALSHRASNIFFSTGDLHRALAYAQRGLELFTQIGDIKSRCGTLGGIADVYLQSGDLENAERYLQQSIDETVAAWSQRFSYEDLALIALCRKEWMLAHQHLQKLLRLSLEQKQLHLEIWAQLHIGMAHLAQAHRKDALMNLQDVFVGLVHPDVQYKMPKAVHAVALAALSEAYQDEDALRAFYQPLREANPGLRGPKFVQLTLEPAEPDTDFNAVESAFDATNFSEMQKQIAGGAWHWNDPFEDCTYTLQDSLTIHAANGRNLWECNRSAPRLLRQMDGDFAIETVCTPNPPIDSNFTEQSTSQPPAIGGLLIWQDERNYLCLTSGQRGRHEITFGGCLDNEDLFFGRGRLPSEQLSLRLERRGQRINALCSADGEQWYSVGAVDVVLADPLRVGLYAVGAIYRLIYLGAFPDGAVIRFKSLRSLRAITRMDA